MASGAASNNNNNEETTAQTNATTTTTTTTTTNNNNDTSHANANANNMFADADAVVTEQQQRTVQVQGLPLEWTQLGRGAAAAAAANAEIRFPSDVADIDPADTELCIVGTAGQKITHMGSDFSGSGVGGGGGGSTSVFSAEAAANLQSLILRSHVIRKIEGLQHFTGLQLLELYDNQVESLGEGCLNSGTHGCPGTSLRVLDMSYNSIRDMAPVAQCPNLQELYLANNKLKTMAGLKGLSQLKKIDLGANRIRVMDADELSGLVNLEELWLGKNKIEMIEGLETLTKLRRLDVQSNRLTTVENLTAQRETLEELYLSHNAITTEGASIATGLAQDFSQLSVLDLCRNRLTTCHPFGHLKGLEELWLSGNEIATFDDVQPIATIQLETIYLEYNPLQEDPLYRKKLAQVIPSLKQIDANMIAGLPHGMTSYVSPKIVETEEQLMHRLQDMALARAQAETRGESQPSTSSK